MGNMVRKVLAKMLWYKVEIDSVGTYDLRNGLNAGYKFDHSKRYDGDVNYVAGGMGWLLRADPNANPRQTRTLRDHVLAFSGKGIYLSYGVLSALGVERPDGPYILVGTAKFFKFTADLSGEIEHHVGYERRSERERFVQERNAGIWNALLGLAQDYQCEPFREEVN